MYLYNNDLQEMRSNDYVVEIFANGVAVERVACFHAAVNDRIVFDRGYCDRIKQMSFCSFTYSFEKPLTVKITPNREFRNFCVRPFGGVCERHGDGIIFELTKPAKLSIEFDGDIFENLFLFAELENSEVPDKNDENVLWFGKGVHDAGVITLKDNQTLYLEGGAWVYGRVVCENAKNVKILGNGVLNGKFFEHDHHKGGRFQELRFIGCENVTVKDLIILDSPEWTMCFDLCKNVTVDNVKEICYARNSDGIDLTGCCDVVMKNVFFRNFDDCISIKARHYGLSGDCRNILVENCIFWADAAHAMLVGPESSPETQRTFENIVFSDITVLQDIEFFAVFQGVMSLFCADNAIMRNITFKNIFVDRMDLGRLISINFTTAYAETVGKKIENVHFENIRYDGNELYGSRIIAVDSEHTIENVTVKDMYVCGRKQTNENNSFEVSDFVNELTFE